MGQVDLPQTPAGTLWGKTAGNQSHPEKSHLIAITVPFRIFEVPVIIPPLGFEWPVNPMVPGKLKLPARQGGLEFGRLFRIGRVDAEKQEEEGKKGDE